MIHTESARVATALLLAGLVSTSIGPAHPISTQDRRSLRIDGERALRHLGELAEFGGTAAGGTSRVAFSDADVEGRDYVGGLMEAAGLEVSIDIAGNLVGRRAGSDPDLAPLVLGSHIDSVPDGGSYDGQVGSIGAIEVVQTLLENQIVTRHPLEVVIFINEEGGKTGSRALIGELHPHELEIVTASGYTIGEGIRRLGGDPARLDSARRAEGDVAGYLELHIEQGAILEKEGIDIGVVEGIVGLKRWFVTVGGFANHAGTTPMNDRRDALVAAARFVQAVNEVARATPGRQVATVGQISASPGAPNVIPGEVRMSLEIRDLDMDKIETIYRAIRAEAEAIAETSETSFAFEEFYVSYAAPTAERLRDIVTEAAGNLGYTSLAMPSGAGHDAQSIARLGPVGMIFVPSVGGISHSPREYSEPDAIVAGINVLLHTLLRLDQSS